MEERTEPEHSPVDPQKGSPETRRLTLCSPRGKEKLDALTGLTKGKNLAAHEIYYLKIDRSLLNPHDTAESVTSQVKATAFGTESEARVVKGQRKDASAYQSDGRRMSVSATGDKFDTLELFSALIFKGSHTLAAAEEILGSETMKMAKQLKFKRIEIKGTRYSVAYFVQ